MQVTFRKYRNILPVLTSYLFNKFINHIMRNSHSGHLKYLFVSSHVSHLKNSEKYIFKNNVFYYRILTIGHQGSTLESFRIYLLYERKIIIVKKNNFLEDFF